MTALLLGLLNNYTPLVVQTQDTGEPTHPSESLSAANWSNPETWGGSIPDETTEVIIPKDKRIVLDQDAVAKNIIVRGTLEVADTGDYSLDTGWLLVDGGAFKIGTPEDPFESQFTFTIQDYDPTAMVNCSENGGHYFFKNHFVGAYGGATMHGAGETEYCNSNGDSDAVGKISIHAADTKTEWTQLDATMEQGATQLSVLDATGWQVGDRLAIASTDYDHRQTEERTITAVDGNNVTVDQPVEYMHYGEITYGVDERGEVANLTRNVTFQTDAQLAETNSTAQTFLDKVTRQLKVKRLNFFVARSGKTYIDGIAIDKAGQEGQLGKYPFHWHHAGNVTGQYVKNSVFSDSLNKCISVHVSDGALIENNVGYYSAGHCFYLEHDETSEIRSQNNLFKDNLSLETNIPLAKQRVKDYDNLAAGFWVTHPNNRFVGNVAGGSGSLDGSYRGRAERNDGNGFWFEIMDLEKLPKDPIAQFEDNKAHSNSSTAFWINSPGRYNHSGRVEINNFVAYKNRVSNFWVRMMSTAGANFVVNNSTFADSLSGLYYASDGAINNYSVGEVNNSLFVAETDNKGTVQPGYDEIVGLDGRTLPLNNDRAVNRGQTGVRAIEVYDGASTYDGNTFVNYQSNAQRPASAFTPPYNTPWGMIPYVPIRNSTLINSNEAYFQPGFWNQGVQTSVYYDVDGSLTGTPDSYITSNQPTIREDENCEFKAAWRGYHCTGERGYVHLNIYNHEPYRHELVRFQLNRRLNDTVGRVMKLNQTDRWQRHYLTNLKTNEWYDFVEYGYSPTPVKGVWEDLDWRLRFGVDDDAWVGLSYPYTQYPEQIAFESTGVEDIQEVFTRQAVEASEASAYYYDYDEARLYFKLYVRDVEDNVNNSIYTHEEDNIDFQAVPPSVGWRTQAQLSTRQRPTVQNDETLAIPAASVDKDSDYRNRNALALVCGINSVSAGSAEADPEYARNLLYTPPVDFVGEATVDYELCDEAGQTIIASHVETIEVTAANERPEFTIDDAEILTNAQNAPVAYDVSDADNNFDLSAGSTLELKSAPAHGTLEIDADTMTYTPDPDFSGRDEAVVLACDTLNGCDLATFTADVGNSAPVVTDDSAVVDKSQQVLVDVLANDTDPDTQTGDSLSICDEDGYTRPSYGAVRILNESFEYTPYPGYTGSDSFVYRACDLNGARAEGTVQITVNETDGLPYANLDEIEVDEDTTVTFDPVENDYSSSGRQLCASNPYTEPSAGTLSRNGANLTYTPNADFAGQDSFTYRVCNDAGEAAEGEVRLTITAVNDAPVANPDTVDISANEVAIITPIDNDTDVEGAVLLICEENALTQPARGVAYRESDTLVSYQPSDNETYTDTFTYQLCEEDGSEEVTGTITVNVTKHTLAPVATDDEYRAQGNQTLNLEVLANDSDADSEFGICTENGFTRPAHGTLTLADEVFVYTPETDYVGTDEFTYTLCDLDGNRATARVILTLLEPTPDLPPILRNQKLQAYPGNEVTFASLGELTSDEEVETVAYTLSELDEKLDCLPTTELSAQTEITCTPALDIAPNMTYTFEVTPQDISGQTGETARFEVEILPLLNPTIELDAEIPDPQAPLTGQAVTLKLAIKNPNPVPIRDIQTSLYLDSDYASFRDADQTSFRLPWNVPAYASAEVNENTLQKDFALDTLNPLETQTYEVVIIPKQNSLGPIRAETAITGLGVDNETTTLEDYATSFEENRANQTPSQAENPTPPGVVTTPRTGGGTYGLLVLGLLALLGGGLYWVKRLS